MKVRFVSWLRLFAIYGVGSYIGGTYRQAGWGYALFAWVCLATYILIVNGVFDGNKNHQEAQ